MPKRKYTKRQKRVVWNHQEEVDQDLEVDQGLGDRSRARSRSRASSRSRQSPRTPINEELFQHVDPIAMNVYRNTQAIQKIMKDLNIIKRALNIPEQGPERPIVVPQEVDG